MWRTCISAGSPTCARSRHSRRCCRTCGPTSSCSRATSRSVPAMGSSSGRGRSEEHTSELQSHHDLVCRLLLEKKKKCYEAFHSSLETAEVDPLPRQND